MADLSIDPKLIKRALEVSGERTKEAGVTKALQEFIARQQQGRVLELLRKFEWDAGYDYKAERVPSLARLLMSTPIERGDVPRRSKSPMRRLGG